MIQHAQFHEIINFAKIKNNINLAALSSRGGLEVEQWTDNSTLSISVGSNPARRQKRFP